MLTLSDQAKAILATITGLCPWFVKAHNLMSVAQLVELGFASVKDEPERIGVYPTTEGIAEAKRLGLIKENPSKPREWVQTDLGKSFDV